MAPGMDNATTSVTNVHGSRLALRLLSNYVFQSMNWGIRLFEQLLLIPLYIFAWGTELYRDWLILFAVVVFLNWCNFGVDDYFGNIFLRSAATGDRNGLRRQVRLGLFVTLVITAVILVAVYGTLLTTTPAEWLGLTAMSESTVMFCLLAMTLPLWVLYSAETLRGVYRAHGDFSRGECVFAIYNALQILSIAIALALRQPPEVIALCYCVLPIIYCILTTIDMRRRYAVVELRLAVPTRAELREIVRQSLLYFTTPLAMALTQNATLLVFGVLNVSAAATVRYNVLRVFTGLTRQMGIQSFAVGSGIEMARQYAQEDHSACRRLYGETGRIVACLVGLLTGVSIPLSDPFVRLWTHGEVSNEKAMILWFLAGIFLSAPGRASLMLLRYSNHANSIAIANCAQAAGGLLLSLLLVPRLGALGAAIGFAITEIVAVGLYPPIIVGVRFGFGALRHVLGSFAAGAGAFAVSYAAAWWLVDPASDNLFVLARELVLWGLLIAPAAALLILPRAQRARLFAAVRRPRASGLAPLG
jgi:O-antigen/teichoic acid export membrane protein